MTDKVRQAAPIIWEEIQKAKSVLLSFHRGPDGDSFGSNLALAQVLKKAGKNVTVIKGDSVMSDSLKAFPGYETVVLKNIKEINLSNFDLFIILDSSSLPQVSRLPNIAFPANLTVVVLDHHLESAVPAKIMLNDTSYPALAQMLFDLFHLWAVTITPEIALCLFLAIYTDSKFRYPGTSSETFEAAAMLVKIYPNFSQAVNTFENSLTAKQLKYWSVALASAKYPFSGQVGLSCVSFKKLTDLAILPEIISTASITEILRSVAGVKISVALAEKEKNVVYVSFRSFEKDVAKIAIALNGGGHAGASGTVLNMPLKQAEKTVLEALGKIYSELGTP